MYMYIIMNNKNRKYLHIWREGKREGAEGETEREERETETERQKGNTHIVSVTAVVHV